MSGVFVIAELGSCHDMSLPVAENMIATAHACGADAVKFQYWSSAQRMADRRRAPSYLNIYKKYQIPVGWLPLLWRKAQGEGIEFMCSTYLPEDVPVVAPFVSRMKIASFEANDVEHLSAHVEPSNAGKQIIVSMGMGADHTVVQRVLGYDVTLLHCVSAYPTPTSQLAIGRCGYYHGYSDHAGPSHTWTGALAVAAGATIIERHMRSLVTSRMNPDYGHAMGPHDFTTYVSNVRYATKAVHYPGRYEAQPSEAAMSAFRVVIS